MTDVVSKEDFASTLRELADRIEKGEVDAIFALVVDDVSPMANKPLDGTLPFEAYAWGKPDAPMTAKGDTPAFVAQAMAWGFLDGGSFGNLDAPGSMFHRRKKDD